MLSTSLFGQISDFRSHKVIHPKSNADWFHHYRSVDDPTHPSADRLVNNRVKFMRSELGADFTSSVKAQPRPKS
jgi:hypothetical protein